MYHPSSHAFADQLTDDRPALTAIAYLDPPRFVDWNDADDVVRPAFSGWRGMIKRMLDILMAVIACVVLSPLFALIAVLIHVDSDGPILFRQTRIGYAGRPFQVLKFRTMYHRFSEYEVRCQAQRHDWRVTHAGNWLRRSSLDELPQLINVLRGEMSIIGPRPHAPGTCAGGRPFEQIMARYGERHRVPPGMTGLAQVRGWRGETDTEEKLIYRVESDLEYVARWSLSLDFVILLRTLIAVLGMRNAY